MKYTHRTWTGILALMLVLGSVGCGKAQEAGKMDDVTSTEPALVTSTEHTLPTELDTAVEESPGKTWLVPSEADCPAASREDTPLVMTVEDVSPTQATLVLRAKDGSEFDIGYGAAYSVSRFGENGWKRVGADMVFAEWARFGTVDREFRDTIQFGANGVRLEPGYYRVEKNFFCNIDGKFVGVDYYAYFEITE